MRTNLHHLFIALALLAGVHSALAQTTPVSIAQAGDQVLLSWPVTTANWVLQGTPSLSPTNWSTNLPAPVVVNGTNTVTISISGTQQFYELAATTVPPITVFPGMALIPAGAFTMGDTLDGESDAIPTNVYVSAFYMDTNLVSYSQWQAVYSYATANGYVFYQSTLFGSYVAGGKGANYPVETVDWYDCVKWCNARSQQAGLTPAYYTDVAMTQIYKTGEVTVYANWSENGYRLPTEAEWEKAARGGVSGQRFPWGDTISESQANYYPGSGEPYDLGGTQIYGIGAYPWTSPGGSFAPNGYGLNDMAGNVDDWCWDWYAGPTYPAGSPYLGGTDPRGPVGPLSVHVVRGGSWGYVAGNARCACRNYYGPTGPFNDLGFRCVRGL